MKNIGSECGILRIFKKSYCHSKSMSTETNLFISLVIQFFDQQMLPAHFIIVGYSNGQWKPLKKSNNIKYHRIVMKYELI